MKNELNKNKSFKLYYYIKNKKIIFPERDFVHIKDMNSLLFKILSKLKKYLSSKVYNVGRGKPTNIKKLVEIYENQAKIKIKYNLKKINKTELKSVFADIKKVKSDFSWSPKYTIRFIVKSYI